MKVLVTGGSGFVGRHLLRDLTQAGHDVLCASDGGGSLPGVTSVRCDVTDAEGMRRVCAGFRPDGVVHLAGIAHVVTAGKDPKRLVDVNVVGTHNVCAAVRATCTSPVPVVLASSVFVYGTKLTGQVRISESTPLAPDTAYGHSKVAAEGVMHAYADPQGLRPYGVRPFNHIGPEQSPQFVCAAFAKRIAETPDGGTIEVGNLDAWRDFSDVRDVVRAYRLILEKQPQATTFVLGSGRTRRVREVLDMLIKVSGKKIETTTKADLLRTQDDGNICADTTLAARELGWSCQIAFERTIVDTYEEALRASR